VASLVQMAHMLKPRNPSPGVDERNEATQPPPPDVPLPPPVPPSPPAPVPDPQPDKSPPAPYPKYEDVPPPRPISRTGLARSPIGGSWGSLATVL
jgi:periplasmic protein TonB